MMKRCALLASVLLFFFSPVWAQKNVAKLERNLAQNVARITKRQLLKRVPAKLQKRYSYDIHSLIDGNRLSLKAYPALALHNDALLSRALDQFVEQERIFSEHSADIAANIASRVYDRVPYALLLPKEVDVLYLGEIHSIPRVQQEIGTIVKSLRAVYPGRNIYLAAESVPAAFGRPFSKEDLIFSPQELERRVELVAELAGLEVPEVLDSFSVIYQAFEENIPVLGLEKEEDLLHFATPEGRDFPTEKQYEQVVTSLVGMKWRNLNFAKGINMLRAADPAALVVVYGGMDHFAYHQPSAVPALVNGKPFVVQVAVPSALPGANPLFMHFSESNDIRRGFNRSPDAKLAEFWKKPTSLNQILGNDLTIIVHE